MSDDNKCHVCGKPEYHDRAGDAFLVRECDKCERPVCQDHAEVDYDATGDPLEFRNCQWQCSEECLLDLRVPLAVTFDLFIDNVKPGEVEEVIRKLCDAAITAKLEDLIADKFDEGETTLGSSTRWQPAEADIDEVGARTHARSGSFYPWKKKVAA